MNIAKSQLGTFYVYITDIVFYLKDFTAVLVETCYLVIKIKLIIT